MANVMDLIFEGKMVNVALLHEELAEAVGQWFVGVSAVESTDVVRVHVWADMPEEMQGQIATVIAAHDATQLTAEQQTQAEQNAQIVLLQQKPPAEWTSEDKDALLVLLAQRMGVLSVAG